MAPRRLPEGPRSRSSVSAPPPAGWRPSASSCEHCPPTPAWPSCSSSTWTHAREPAGRGPVPDHDDARPHRHRPPARGAEPRLRDPLERGHDHRRRRLRAHTPRHASIATCRSTTSSARSPRRREGRRSAWCCRGPARTARWASGDQGGGRHHASSRTSIRQAPRHAPERARSGSPTSCCPPQGSRASWRGSAGHPYVSHARAVPRWTPARAEDGADVSAVLRVLRTRHRRRFQRSTSRPASGGGSLGAWSCSRIDDLADIRPASSGRPPPKRRPCTTTSSSR